MKTILVTGSKGQLGNELQLIAKGHPDQFIFVDVDELDITDSTSVNSYFLENEIDFCINCAAYTAVDKAESEQETAFKINADGVKNLASASKITGAVFIHISTDFVFSGDQNKPYKEEDKINPLSIYGESKKAGEENALNFNAKSIVIRTSWLYSSFGNNFVKTMIRLGRERESLGVVMDQIGVPTYARDLAQAVISIIDKIETDGLREEEFGLYQYSNKGVASWYDFAKAVFDLTSIKINLRPIFTEEYPLPAKRPAYSVMNTRKIQEKFNLDIPYWRDSLNECINEFRY
ncbi:dTDP-4-dehydrorhamnose reductase [Flexithrix dorotheae]|uniref:dTDP-4-dehydrorhamnose reductase n=1 Tax=Flexithrix dorotheae TaxID=70993 RepID=UPI0003627590|nr:dTDP-4-dehydrorhamnose reductase [Flexithrix dorotheae]